MRRIIAVFICLVTLLAFVGNSAEADDIELDLQYDTTTNTWELYAEVTAGSPDTVDGSYGISAVRALIDNIDFGTLGDAVTIVSGIGAIDPIDEGGLNERPPVLQTTGGTLDIIYGQDLSEVYVAVVGGVGVGGPTHIASGSYSSTVPSWGDDDNGFTSQGLFLNTFPGPFGGALLPDHMVLFTTNVTVPEPSTVLLALLGLVGIGYRSRKQR